MTTWGRCGERLRPLAPTGLAALGWLLAVSPAPVGATQPVGCAVARVVLTDEAGARRLAEQVARQCFLGTGTGGSPLVYSRIELRAEPGPSATARWWVWIPETRSDLEPSGLYLTLDASTGAWTRRRTE